LAKGGTIVLDKVMATGNMMADKLPPKHCFDNGRKYEQAQARAAGTQCTKTNPCKNYHDDAKWAELGAHNAYFRRGRHVRYDPSDFPCVSVSAVNVATSVQTTEGVKAEVALRRTRTYERTHDRATWFLKYNCRCNPYIEVSSATTFRTNRVSVSISGEPLCNNVKPWGEGDMEVHEYGRRRKGFKQGDTKITKEKFDVFKKHMIQSTNVRPRHGQSDSNQAFPNMRVVLLSRTSHDGQWMTYPEDFVFNEPTAFDLQLPVSLKALQLRIQVVCTRHSDPDSRPEDFNYRVAPFDLRQNDEATFEPKYRTIEVKVHGTDSRFNWNETVKENLATIIKESHTEGASDIQNINCTKVNQNSAIAHQFEQWQTPSNGQFVQEPDEHSESILLANEHNWTAFASKRNTGTLGFHVEKRLICLEAGREQNEPMVCCVNKLIWPLSKSAPAALKSNNTQAAILRNF
jgi:hypothetical protein